MLSRVVMVVFWGLEMWDEEMGFAFTVAVSVRREMRESRVVDMVLVGKERMLMNFGGETCQV